MFLAQTMRLMVLALIMVDIIKTLDAWQCPEIKSRNVTCSCDIPRTLRCNGQGDDSINTIAEKLKSLKQSEAVSLLDCTVHDLQTIAEPILQGVSLLGFVVSSGVLRKVSEHAFSGLASPLQALGLPNNQLEEVPTAAISHLTYLTRLDFSNNHISIITGKAFTGLKLLLFLDISYNKLERIHGSAFERLTELKVLKMSSNRLTTESLSTLKGLQNLEEVDLSHNSITGPLGSTSLPKLLKLVTLNLADNQITSVTEDSLLTTPGLISLNLEYNMIDVLEDDAFRYLNFLRNLNLAHNRIVSVSEDSLGHLYDLLSLDLSHNFLRALTMDLLEPLLNLKELRLDDNDISMVDKHALDNANNLEILSILDNPLNCDCSLASFASWLRNSSVQENYKKTAVCATPRALENGLVVELLPTQLYCDLYDDFDLDTNIKTVHASKTNISLEAFHYDGETASLLWNIQPSINFDRYAFFVYETLGNHEIVLEHRPVKCNSTDLENPGRITVTIESSLLEIGHKYRYCLLILGQGFEPILGQTEPLSLEITTSPILLSFKANFTAQETLLIRANVWPSSKKNCLLQFIVRTSHIVLYKSKLNCSLSSSITLKQITRSKPYQICAIVSAMSPKCLFIPAIKSLSEPNSRHIFSVSLIVFVVIFTLIIAVYKLIKYTFCRVSENDNIFMTAISQDQQNSRYTKLQSTTTTNC